MKSERPWNRQTVPLRPGGGAQRAKRSETPSGVFRVPETTLSGTGLAGMETRVMDPRAGSSDALYQGASAAQSHSGAEHRQEDAGPHRRASPIAHISKRPSSLAGTGAGPHMDSAQA